jgi:hypothetical protein
MRPCSSHRPQLAGVQGTLEGERRDSNPRPPGPQPGSATCSSSGFGSPAPFEWSSVVLTCPHFGPRIRPRVAFGGVGVASHQAAWKHDLGQADGARPTGVIRMLAARTRLCALVDVASRRCCVPRIRSRANRESRRRGLQRNASVRKRALSDGPAARSCSSPRSDSETTLAVGCRLSSIPVVSRSAGLVGQSDNHVGDVSGFAPPGDIHRVHNTADTTAISIPVYGTDVTRVGSSARRYYD